MSLQPPDPSPNPQGVRRGRAWFSTIHSKRNGEGNHHVPVSKPATRRFSPADAAAFLSLSKKTIHRLIARGKLVAKKSGPRTLVTTESLLAYFASLPTKPAVRP